MYYFDAANLPKTEFSTPVYSPIFIVNRQKRHTKFIFINTYSTIYQTIVNIHKIFDIFLAKYTNKMCKFARCFIEMAEKQILVKHNY